MEVVDFTTRTALPAILCCAAVLGAPALAHAEDAAPAQAAPTQTAPAQAAPAQDRTEVVSVKRYTLGRTGPKVGARGVTHLWTNTGFSGRRAMYPVMARRMVGTSEWVRVKVLRHRRQVGAWIPAWVTRKRFIDWRITVDLSSRRATITRLGKVVRRYRVVVGAPSTPTPRGHFYVMDHLRLHTSWAPGKWALATSAFSNVLRRFEGGEGQVALHAKGFLSNPLGTAASHGCVRFANGAVAWLARKIPNGTPVDIKP